VFGDFVQTRTELMALVTGGYLFASTLRDSNVTEVLPALDRRMLTATSSGANAG
jgi:hypothetical protein